ncbi:YbhN family protein [Tabrizicola sp. YIM 78059]|uniref:lysylphosphatidylglycerol synthase transmembrane domain-containing protein n=1 Tax=Tabrizicola sp. YIM 78059 TaxID=2529861 RepID=UPI00145AD37D|nr:YbhN family protein [Tabrizicola sp. YIM 78059]
MGIKPPMPVDAEILTERPGFWPRIKAAFPYIVAAGLFAVGLWALYRLLAPVNLAEVAAQVHATPWTTLALALAATFCGYLSLAGYDWSALRYIGKPLPVPVVLTGGLMAYAFGNTIGLTAVSGGAVRWRVYSGLGLDGYDVAAVSTFAAVSFGVAATVVGLWRSGPASGCPRFGATLFGDDHPAVGHRYRPCHSAAAGLGLGLRP